MQPSKPCHSSLGSNAPKKPRKRLNLLTMRLLILLLLFGAALHLAVTYKISGTTRLVASSRSSPTLESSAPTTFHLDSLEKLNWTTCPSKRGDPTVLHFKLWDEKLAQSLRLSPQAPLRMENESWHAVTDHIHVFSAFLVTTMEHAIHITSLVRIYEPKGARTLIRHPPLVCIIRTSNATVTRKAHMRLVFTYFSPKFQNALILCPPPNEAFPEVDDVRVAVAAQGAVAGSLRWLRLHRPPKKSKNKCCAVCVRPLFGALSLWKIVEFIANYRVLGTKSFYFYDLNMTSDLKLLFARMQSWGVDLTLVSFKLIVDTTVINKDVHAHGQMPALYDCIFRSLFKMEYYMHVDIDELMFPLRDNSIPAIVRKMERKSKRSIGSLVVPMRFHCYEYPLNLRYARREYLPLQTRLFPYHSVHLHTIGLTKYIARSRTVCDPRVHQVWGHCAQNTEHVCIGVSAVVKHYKQCCIYKPRSDNDKLASFYNDTLISPDHTFEKLSTHIEGDPVVRALRNLIGQADAILTLRSKTLPATRQHHRYNSTW
ncbi:uncharacterized protein LOC142563791 [Dermacentor variabilis]|uniref:uncharacterized protein LOC142563791 n=1 Tax=Dermacentor variabilis TaxID=34621 RepID=UPI003F5C78FD